MAEPAKMEVGPSAESPHPIAARPARWLNAPVLGMGLASFFSDLGHEMATAALPAFIVAIGGTPAALGAIEGLSDGASSFVKIYAGHWVDRTGIRKPLAVAGYAATGLATGAFALATSWWHILIARGLGWAARGARGPARDAMLADAVPAGSRGRAFGFHRACDTAGAVLGPATAYLLATSTTARTIFLFSLVPGLLAAIAFATLVKRDDRRPQPQLTIAGGLRGLPPAFRQFLFAIILFGVGDFSHTLLILRTTEVLTPARGAVAAAALGIAFYVSHNVLYAIAAYPAGRLGDRIGKRRLLAAGYALGALVALGFALGPEQPWLLATLFTLGGVVLAIEDALEGSLTADLVGEHQRGTGYGVLAAANGVGDSASSIGIGLLWAAGGAQLGFGIAAALCAAGALALALPMRAHGEGGEAQRPPAR